MLLGGVHTTVASLGILWCSEVVGDRNKATRDVRPYEYYIQVRGDGEGKGLLLHCTSMYVLFLYYSEVGWAWCQIRTPWGDGCDGGWRKLSDSEDTKTGMDRLVCDGSCAAGHMDRAVGPRDSRVLSAARGSSPLLHQIFGFHQKVTVRLFLSFAASPHLD